MVRLPGFSWRAVLLALFISVFLGMALVLTGCDTPTEHLERDSLSQSSAFILSPASMEEERPGRILPDQYLVRFHPEAVEDVLGIVEALLEGVEAEIHFVYRRVFQGFWATLPEEFVATLTDHRIVDWISPVRLMPFTAGSTSQWGLSRISQRELPLNNYFDPRGGTGDGVHIYIVDSGIRAQHVEFGNRVSGNYFDIGGDGPGGGGDCSGHGTRVAGVAGGANNGVAQSSTLYSVRITDCSDNSSVAALSAGLEWIIDYHNSPAVVNISGAWLDSSLDSTEIATIEDAIEGVLDEVGSPIVLAAANYNQDACTYYPAKFGEDYDGVITVGASNKNDERWSSSNWGNCLDIFAPGDSIRTPLDAWPFESYEVRSGTSYAAPFVTGIAAIFLETNPTATPAQVWTHIADSATVGELSSIGTGSPDSLAFIAQAVSAEITGPMAPGPTMNQWNSNPAGGDFQDYNILWERQEHFSWGSGGWVNLGTSQIVQITLHQDNPDFTLRVTVQSAGDVDIDSKYIYGPCHDGGTCP
jgi:aqualysin 1